MAAVGGTDAVLNGLIGGGEAVGPEAAERGRYLGRLASLNLDRIKAEPKVLAQEYEAVNRQIDEFAFKHYRPFVETARCMDAIHTQLSTMHTHLSGVHDTLPGLSASAAQFQDDAKDIIERRNVVANALSHHAQLTEILEIPKLMDTLVRTEAFEEALELANYVARLKARHPEARVIGDIAAEVERSCTVMAAILLRLLRGEVQLPDCLRFVSYIRRLRRFDEGELRWHFLACRDCWFERRNQWSHGSAGSPRAADAQLVSDRANDAGESQASAGPRAEEDAYELLMRLTDNLRLHGFGIITQYRAIFTEESNGEGDARGGGWEQGGGLLYSWAMEKLSTLLAALEALLPQITTGARLSSLLSQVMYAGAALGRAGVEFRPLLPPLFEPALLSVFKTRLRRASEMFAESLDSFQWMRFKSHAALSAGAAEPVGAVEAGARKAAANMEDIIQLPPLAIFLNGLLDALNDIRGCAPTNMVSDAAQALQLALNHASARILASREDGGELWSDLCEVYATQLIPHIVACFEKLFRGSDRRVTWEARGGAQLSIEVLKRPLKAVLEEAINARIAEEQRQALAAAKPSAATVATTDGPPDTVATADGTPPLAGSAAEDPIAAAQAE